MLTTEQIAELRKKLDPKHVKPPSKFGPKGEYIEGWHAISEANEIFGFDGWSYTIKSLTQDALDLGKNSKGEEQWQASYTCLVTLTVGGTIREDVGFGSGFAKGKGDAIEGATKEAVTDALKRALRTFGNRFGLALYDKSRENVGVEKRKATSAEKRDWFKGKVAAFKDLGQLNAWWEGDKVKAALETLDEPHRLEIENDVSIAVAFLAQAPGDAA